MLMKLGILGCDGSMGQLITRLALDDPEIEISIALTEVGSPNIDVDIASLVGRAPCGVKIQDISNLEQKIRDSAPDVVTDFTIAKATEENAPVIVQQGISMIIGTTALSNDFMDEIIQLIKQNNAPSVIASNMATGMNLFMKTVGDVAKALIGWDTEIIEAHHNKKFDSPSGTALSLAKIISDAFEEDLDEVAKYGRPKGPGPRKIGRKELGIHSIRAGEIVGDHTVLFAGPGERIELIHRAQDRTCFASGAINAAKFLIKGKREPRLYTIREILGM